MPDQPAASLLTLDVERCSPEVVVILCHGKLISTTGNILYSQVCKLLPGTKKLTLNLCDVNYMDSMGLGTLVRIYVSTKSAGCQLILKNLGKRVRELLGVSHLLGVFTVIGENGIKIGF
jgi:anti-sigma B factor antagonist